MKAELVRNAARPIRVDVALGFIVLVLFGLAGCTTPNSGGHSSDRSGHAEGSAKLALNDGSKWVVAPPMMKHIRALETDVQDFETSGGDHATLAGRIQENLGRLVTNCTMEGRAHDELHKWLMPFLALSTEYADASDRPVQQQKYRQIKGALVVFNQYFE